MKVFRVSLPEGGSSAMTVSCSQGGMAHHSQHNRGVASPSTSSSESRLPELVKKAWL